MRLSRYNICVYSRNKWLVYNLLKSTCVILDENEYERFQKMSSKKDEITYVDLGMYIDDDYDELNEVFYYFKRNTDAYNQDFRKHRIYTTTSCNAKCYYCFEKKMIGETMNTLIADKVVDRILNKQKNAKHLTITWFGGEPLINMDIMDYISKQLKQKLPTDVEYNSFMITNGLLLDETVIKRAIDVWNLEAVQITIDGLKNTYEKVKQFGKKDAFEIIINNIHCALSSGLKVRIRINYNNDNVEEVLSLIDYLSLEYNDRSLLFVYAHRIFSDYYDDNSKLSSENNDIKIWNRLRLRGFVNDILSTINPHLVSCTAGNLYNEMFLPNGDIGKCALAISKGEVIGDVNNGILNKLIAKWCCGIIDNKCIECNIFPICGGGCLYERLNDKNGCFVSEGLLRHKLITYLNESVTEDVL